MNAIITPTELRRPVRGPLRLYALIVVLYVALVGWWVTFFGNQGDHLIARVEAVGGRLLDDQQQAIREVTDSSQRMFLFEGTFLGLLLAASILLVLRSVRREVHLARRQRDFVSAVTHELRSPLASARLYLDTLLLREMDPDKTRRYLTHAREDLTRLSELVEEVLTARAMTEVGMELHPETVNLSDLVKRRVARLVELHPGTALDVRADGAVRVHADPRSLEQVLDNLVSNAVKYGGHGEPVVISVTETNGRGRLEVQDGGPGLQGADPDALTEAFVRGQDEDVRTHPGVGLGLFVVKRLLVAQDGRFKLVDREDGHGLVARVVLPLAHVDEPGAEGSGGAAS